MVRKPHNLNDIEDELQELNENISDLNEKIGENNLLTEKSIDVSVSSARDQRSLSKILVYIALTQIALLVYNNFDTGLMVTLSILGGSCVLWFVSAYELLSVVRRERNRS